MLKLITSPYPLAHHGRHFEQVCVTSWTRLDFPATAPSSRTSTWPTSLITSPTASPLRSLARTNSDSALMINVIFLRHGRKYSVVDGEEKNRPLSKLCSTCKIKVFVYTVNRPILKSIDQGTEKLPRLLPLPFETIWYKVSMQSWPKLLTLILVKK